MNIKRKMFAAITLFVLAVSAASCGNETIRRAVDPANCDGLSMIKEIPAKAGLQVNDVYYNSIRSNPSEYKACLIEKLDDDSTMSDPRREPTKVDSFAVGDLAFFLLSDFGFVEFDQVLPNDVRQDLSTQGVRAYFEWVGTGDNRRLLQKKCREWIESTGRH